MSTEAAENIAADINDERSVVPELRKCGSGGLQKHARLTEAPTLTKQTTWDEAPESGPSSGSVQPTDEAATDALTREERLRLIINEDRNVEEL